MTIEESSAVSPPPGRLAVQLLARLSDSAAVWADGGPITRWTPVFGRASKQLAQPGLSARYVLARTSAFPADPSVRRWLEHQRHLLTERPTVASPTLVFWRLAVRQRAFALDAQPSPDVPAASESVRAIGARWDHLRVALGFYEHESIPAWVVYDDTTPVMVGLPHYHLVPTHDPATSLGALVGAARLKPQVHEIATWP